MLLFLIRNSNLCLFQKKIGDTDSDFPSDKIDITEEDNQSDEADFKVENEEPYLNLDNRHQFE